jgi:hypothetical protein
MPIPKGLVLHLDEIELKFNCNHFKYLRKKKFLSSINHCLQEKSNNIFN